MEGRNSSCLASHRNWHVPEHPEGVPPPLPCSPSPQGSGPCMVPQKERRNLILLAFSQNRIMCLISLQCKWKGEIHELIVGEGFQAVLWCPLVYRNIEITVEYVDKPRVRSPRLPQFAALRLSLSDKGMGLTECIQRWSGTLNFTPEKGGLATVSREETNTPARQMYHTGVHKGSHWDLRLVSFKTQLIIKSSYNCMIITLLIK